MNTITTIQFLISRIDKLLNQQLQQIYGDQNFKTLLSNWQEIFSLIKLKSEDKTILVQLLNIEWSEINADINTGYDIENSHLYHIVYESHLGVAGGTPITMLLGQYYINIENKKEVDCLSRIGELAAFSLSPFMTNLSPAVYESEAGSNKSFSLATLNKFNLSEWQSFRKNPNSRFIFMTGPEFLQYDEENATDFMGTATTFSAAFLTIAQLIQSYKDTSWFLNINQNISENILNSLNYEHLQNNNIRYSPIQATYYTNHEDIQNLANFGLSFLLQENKHHDVNISSIYSTFLGKDGNKLLIEQLLTACYFGHYIKVIVQDKIGTLVTESDCEIIINHWLGKYANKTNTSQARMHYPLRSYNVHISPIPGKIGCYNCKILLEPHMRSEALTAKILLNSEVLVPHLR